MSTTLNTEAEQRAFHRGFMEGRAERHRCGDDVEECPCCAAWMAKEAEEAEGWVDLGHVDTNVATVAIVSPLFSGALADWWQGYVEHLRRPHDHENLQYRSVPLETTWSRSFEPTGPFTESSDAVLVSTPMNGPYLVQGRFADTFNGPMQLAEVRIVLYEHGDWGEDLDDDDYTEGESDVPTIPPPT